MELVESAVVDIRLFGGVDVVRPGGGTRLRSRLRRVLLAMLLAHRGEVVSASTLAASLWPDGPPAKWDKGLQVHVHRLRQALGDPGTVTYHPPGYRLAVPGDRVDAYRFEALARQGQASLAHGDPARAAGQLRQALELYRGPAFQGLEHLPDLVVEAHRLAELRLVATEHRITAELAMGEHAGLVAEIEALVAEHPLRERFRAQLMTALYRSGRKADALAAYRTGRHVLVAELGIEPSEECQALERAILADDPSLAAPPVAGGGDGRAAPMPPPAPRQLPPDVTAFTGRAEQLRWLDEPIDQRAGGRPTAAVISAVDGMAGVGKTALIVHWAHRVADRFPDGQLYLDLRGYSAGHPVRPIEALTRFLHALEASPDRLPVDLDGAVARYRSRTAGRRILVVLDNASSADQVRPLLPAGGGCLALVTSRHRLPGLVARDGARRLNLDVLPPGEAVGLLTSLLGPARVAAEPSAVTELAQRCGRLPLAVRVAAAVLISHPSQRIADSVARLRDGDGLASLAIPGDQPATVAAAFDYSYRRLPDPERRMFRWVGLLPGPEVTAAAAAALAGSTAREAARWLRNLAAAHLVEERSASRHTCHDLLRQFAAARARAEVSPADRTGALGRWYEFYLAGTDAAVDLLFPGVLRIPRRGGRAVGGPTEPPPSREWQDPAEAMAWLQAERVNLIAAVRHAAASGPFRVGWQLADSLQLILGAGGFPADALLVAQAGLAAAEADRDPRAQAGAVLAIANLHFRTSRYRLAVAYVARCRRLLRDTGWLAGRGALRFLQGNLCGNSGQPGRAIRHFGAALDLFEQAGSRHGQAAVVSNLAVLLCQQGRLRQAVEYARRAERVYASLGSSPGRADALTDLGGIYHIWGELDRARDCYTRARDLYRVSGASREADAMLGLTHVYLDAGRLDRARELAEAAVALAREAGNQRLEPECLTVLASVYHRLRRPAEQIYRQAVALARDGDNQSREALALLGLAAMRPPPGGYRVARQRATRALEIAREHGFRILVGEVLTRLAEIELAAGSPTLAAHHGEQALACHREVGYRLEEARTRLVLGHAAATTGDPAAARNHWQRAYAIFRVVGVPEAREVEALLAA